MFQTFSPIDSTTNPSADVTPFDTPNAEEEGGSFHSPVCTNATTNSPSLQSPVGTTVVSDGSSFKSPVGPTINIPKSESLSCKSLVDITDNISSVSNDGSTSANIRNCHHLDELESICYPSFVAGTDPHIKNNGSSDSQELLGIPSYVDIVGMVRLILG